jgi:hypothetical protein
MERDASGDFPDLLGHLERVSGVGRRQLGRLLEEVNAYFGESVEQFVTRRHRELQAEELRNDDIFVRIGEELRSRRFAAPELTARQLRRLVYG